MAPNRRLLYKIKRNWGSGFTSSQIIEKVTEIKIDREKGNTKSKRISDIRKLYIKFLKSFADLSNKEIADLYKIRSSTVTKVLSGRYKENDFLIKSSIVIDKNVKLYPDESFNNL